MLRLVAIKASVVSNKGLKTGDNGGIIKEERSFAQGYRTSNNHTLTEDEINKIKSEAKSLNIDDTILLFNKGNQTGFSDYSQKNSIRGDILPDKNSTIARDTMSTKAVLAHEYYGHYKNHPSQYPVGDWRDEFRASYDAATNSPNLSDEERRDLMIDAYDRAKEAGEFIEYDEIARRIIYGY